MSDVTIPEDIRAKAMDLASAVGAGLAIGAAETIARALLAEREVMRERCARLIEEGFDRPVGERYADDPAVRSKNDKCPHGRYMYEDCEQCCAQAIRSSHE